MKQSLSAAQAAEMIRVWSGVLHVCGLAFIIANIILSAILAWKVVW